MHARQQRAVPFVHRVQGQLGSNVLPHRKQRLRVHGVVKRLVTQARERPTQGLQLTRALATTSRAVVRFDLVSSDICTTHA